jgi:hypothetical protein
MLAIIFSIRNLERIKTVKPVNICTKRIQSVLGKFKKAQSANSIKKDNEIRFTRNKSTLNPLNK